MSTTAIGPRPTVRDTLEESPSRGEAAPRADRLDRRLYVIGRLCAQLTLAASIRVKTFSPTLRPISWPASMSKR